MLSGLSFSLNRKARVPIVAAQQRVKRIGGGKDTGGSFDALQQLGIEILGLRPGVAVERGVQVKQEDVARVKAGINAFQIFQRAHKQTSARKNQNSEGHLRDYQ